jgi:hypothetical protein
MTKAEQGRIFINWIRAYLECLNEGRDANLISYEVQERQLRLFR